MLFKRVRKTWDWILLKAFKYHALDTLDEQFLFHANGRPPNVVIVLSTDKFEFAKMQEFLYSSMKDIPRSRAKLVEFFGRVYYADMTQAEWEQKKGEIVQVREGINTLA